MSRASKRVNLYFKWFANSNIPKDTNNVEIVHFATWLLAGLVGLMKFTMILVENQKHDFKTASVMCSGIGVLFII